MVFPLKQPLYLFLPYEVNEVILATLSQVKRDVKKTQYNLVIEKNFRITQCESDTSSSFSLLDNSYFISGTTKNDFETRIAKTVKYPAFIYTGNKYFEGDMHKLRNLDRYTRLSSSGQRVLLTLKYPLKAGVNGTSQEFPELFFGRYKVIRCHLLKESLLTLSRKTTLHKTEITNWFHYGARNQVIYWLILNDSTIQIIYTYPSVFKRRALKSILKTFAQVENSLIEWNEKKLMQLLIVHFIKKVFTQKEKKSFLIMLYKLLSH